MHDDWSNRERLPSRDRTSTDGGCGNNATHDARIATTFATGARQRGEVTPMTATKTDPGFRAQLAGFSLTTAEILYRLPDHPSLLQSYIWQDYDMHPRFPRLRTFLDFWARNLDGKLFGVRVAHKKLITPAEL